MWKARRISPWVPSRVVSLECSVTRTRTVTMNRFTSTSGSGRVGLSTSSPETSQVARVPSIGWVSSVPSDSVVQSSGNGSMPGAHSTT